jgi:hypothetical protein
MGGISYIQLCGLCVGVLWLRLLCFPAEHMHSAGSTTECICTQLEAQQSAYALSWKHNRVRMHSVGSTTECVCTQLEAQQSAYALNWKHNRVHMHSAGSTTEWVCTQLEAQQTYHNTPAHRPHNHTLYDIPPIRSVFQVTQTYPKSSLMMADYSRNM